MALINPSIVHLDQTYSTLARLLWTRREVKGGYTRLESRLRATLITKGVLSPLDEEASFAEEVEAWRTSQALEPPKPPALFWDFVEVFGGCTREEEPGASGSELSRAVAREGWSTGPLIDVARTPLWDVRRPRVAEFLCWMVSARRTTMYSASTTTSGK